MLGDTVNARVVRILLECNLVIVRITYTDTIHIYSKHHFVHCSPPTDTPPGQTPPLGRHPPEQTPPWVDTPLGRHPPRADTPPGRHLPRSRHPLAKHAGRYGQRAGGMHPTGMQSCFCVFLCLYYRPTTKLREGNVFTGVCHSVQGLDGYA